MSIHFVLSSSAFVGLQKFDTVNMKSVEPEREKYPIRKQRHVQNTTSFAICMLIIKTITSITMFFYFYYTFTLVKFIHVHCQPTILYTLYERLVFLCVQYSVLSITPSFCI